ncbi:Copper transport protein ctr4 [Cladophialophora carrionii]|uniref:Copper transport protein n=1 Tax=Cladophialophora carrionii TaxID=86049 RepID=A0A1C1CX62_9EURO|nr:Copper transport protein ctr4 [Cladophialophora carrionii]
MSSMMMMSTATPTSQTSMMTSVSSSVSASDNMSMAGMEGTTCKISMTWNWYTVGACFISQSWQVTTRDMFAGCCIGVILLVMSLELLRRLQREYDGWCGRMDRKAFVAISAGSEDANSSSSELGAGPAGKAHSVAVAVTTSTPMSERAPLPRRRIAQWILVQRHVIRSLGHMVQFGLAYFIMLLAMYYNGYIIISILIGAFLGALVFNWDQVAAE